MFKNSILFISLLCYNSMIYSWPGDQDSLSCIPGPDGAKDLSVRKDIKAQYESSGTYATADENQKAINRETANERVRTIVRANHDMDYEVTKLGDSLYDLVDWYGVATPRKLFPMLGDAGGTFGGNPLYMDSWDDYMTAGSGSANGFKFQNFGKSGNTTLATMEILGIDIDGTRDDWNVKSR